MTGGSLHQRLTAHNEAIRYNVHVVMIQALHIYVETAQAEVEHFAYYILIRVRLRVRQKYQAPHIGPN